MIEADGYRMPHKPSAMAVGSAFYCSEAGVRNKLPGMKRFHLHVYFPSDQPEAARLWRANAALSGLFDSVRLHERPVGPHPTATIEAHFAESAYASALGWVEARRGSFSALIHPDTGDDLKDHTDGARWLGEEVPLRFDFFELVRTRPDLKIHPPGTSA